MAAPLDWFTLGEYSFAETTLEKISVGLGYYMTSGFAASSSTENSRNLLTQLGWTARKPFSPTESSIAACPKAIPQFIVYTLDFTYCMVGQS